MKLKRKFNGTIKDSGFEVYIWFYVIDKLKTRNLLSKNAAEKLKMQQIKNKNINAVNWKNLANADVVMKDI